MSETTKTLDTTRFENSQTVEMAFDHFVGKLPEPLNSLWRVQWLRKWKSRSNIDRQIGCVDYFDNEKAAWDFAGRRIEEGNEVQRVDAFVLASTSQANNGV